MRRPDEFFLLVRVGAFLLTERRRTRRPDDGGGGKLFVSFKIGLFYGVDLVCVGRGDLGFFRLRFFLPI